MDNSGIIEDTMVNIKDTLQYLNDEIAKLKRENKHSSEMIWALITSSGGKLRVPVSVIRIAGNPGNEVSKYEDGNTNEIIFVAKAYNG